MLNPFEIINHHIKLMFRTPPRVSLIVLQQKAKLAHKDYEQLAFYCRIKNDPIDVLLIPFIGILQI